ncbi:Fe-S OXIDOREDUCTASE [Fimbriiglobus ruber]|uniref:Fe-S OXIDOREDUCTASE n=1 Tax=Fimbriiglobus ruber TaxID=1908690 RepID=A0A225EF20_9BACT|nr:Fe-S OXIDOREDUCTASE [Fimbriiglobus ruber]
MWRNHCHAVANPAKGEKPGERGAGPIKPTGYPAGAKTQQWRQGK